MEKHYWKKILTLTSAYYAVISIFVFAVYLITAKNGIYSQAFSVARMLFLLGFCAVFAIANSFLSMEKLNGFYKLILHGALTMGGFFALVYAPLTADGKHHASVNGYEYQSPNFFVVLGLVIILYVISYGIYLVISSRKRKKKNAKSEYRSIYRNK